MESLLYNIICKKRIDNRHNFSVLDHELEKDSTTYNIRAKWIRFSYRFKNSEKCHATLRGTLLSLCTIL